MEKTLSLEFQSSIQDWFRQALDTVTVLPQTESAAKALALNLADQWVAHAGTTATGLDDWLAGKFRTAIETHFSLYWEFIRKGLGLTPKGEENGEPVFGAADLADPDELLEVVRTDSVEVCDQTGREFGVSPTQVLMVLELLLPILLERFRKLA